jgi:sugar lactone lactonase YvrE
MRALGLSLILCGAACSTDRCKQGTLFLSYALTNGAEAADTIDVSLAIGSAMTRTMTVPRKTHSASGAIEVDFASSYPSGQSITVTLTARAGAETLASISQTTTAAPDCTALSFALDGSHADLGGTDLGGDASFDQATPPDLTGPPDLTPPADLAPTPFCQTVTVSTVAGNGVAGFVDGTGGANGTTQFNSLFGLAVDGVGNVYVADTFNNRIRVIAPGGNTTTLAGNGTAGFVDGTGGASGTTQFKSPKGAAVDGAGNVYVADTANQRIRVVAPGGSTTTLSGNGFTGFNDGTGTATGTTRFSAPFGVAVDSAGNSYVADYANNRIRKIAPDGSTTTLAGNGTPSFADGSGGAAGTAEFDNPAGVAVDGAGNVYVADYFNNRIRKIAPDGTTTTLAGNGAQGPVDGAGGVAEFNNPNGVAVDSAGVVYVADSGNNRVRRIAPDGTTVTVAGGPSGYTEGVGCSARFVYPTGIAISGKQLFVADGNNRVRLIQLP